MKPALPILILSAIAAPALLADDPFPVRITVETESATGPWKPIWRFFGADEPNWAI